MDKIGKKQNDFSEPIFGSQQMRKPGPAEHRGTEERKSGQSLHSGDCARHHWVATSIAMKGL